MSGLVFEIEIICKPRCHKCLPVEEKITTILNCMALKEKISIKSVFTYNKNILEAEKYGYKILDLPIVLINGKVAFVGLFKSEHLIRTKLEEILKNPD